MMRKEKWRFKLWRHRYAWWHGVWGLKLHSYIFVALIHSIIKLNTHTKVGHVTWHFWDHKMQKNQIQQTHDSFLDISKHCVSEGVNVLNNGWCKTINLQRVPSEM